ncbi:MAG: FG-GAP-like repeat-containing protein [Candidatus Edwardsbacteria bacterium]|nr:FG-GAP-like repeat-containing protein [Candidatus Edwardsbacteria bacterium]
MQRLKQTWRTARPIFEKLKSQPRRYKDAVSSRNILGQIRAASLRGKGAKAAYPDTLKVLVFKVQFVPDTDTNTTGDGRFDYIGNGQPIYVNNDPAQGHNLDYEPPHDSLYVHNQMLALRNYYWAVSNGRLWIEYEQWPKGNQAAYDMPHQMSFYSDFYNNHQNWGAGIYTLLRDAISAADADTCAFSYTVNGRKITKAVMLIHAGSVWQTDPWGADLPAVFIKMDESSPIIANAGADTVYEACINAETQSQDGMVLGSQGEIAHEFGHQLGLPDLYDVEFYSVGLGEWELMSHGSWNLNAFVPPHLSAWSKCYLGWADPVVLTPGTSVQQSFKWAAKDPGAIVIIPINSHEYYLVENRRAWTNPTNTQVVLDTAQYGWGSDHNSARTWRNGVLVKVDDYDMSLPFELNAGGLLVWHVDMDLILRRWETNTLEVGTVKAIHLKEADHIQDLQRWGGSPYGTYASPYDAYYAGNNDRLDDGSDPASLANDGSSTHISISNISAPAENMSAHVKVGRSAAGFPVSLDDSDNVDWNSPNYAVLNQGQPGEYKVILLPGTNGKLYAWKTNGTGLFNRDTMLALPGFDTVYVRAEFARVKEGSVIYSSLAVADVNLNGQQEVFISTAYSMTEGSVYGFSLEPRLDTVISNAGNPYEIYQAKTLPGFPVTVTGPIYSSVTLGDVNNDDTMEVIVAGDDRRLHVWKFDGTPLDSFPKDLTMETRSTAAVADIDPAYPGKEIVILSGDSRVFAFRGNGQNVPGFPALTPWVDWVSSSVAIGDINRDGKPEIIACNKKGIFVLDNRGSVLNGWPVSHDEIAISSPALGDIDGNGYLDVVVAIGIKLYAYNYNGTLMSGFPVIVSSGPAVQSSPSIADIDGDGKQEVVIGSPDGKVYAFEGSGAPVSGYPIALGGKTYSSPLIFKESGAAPANTYAAIGSDDGKLNTWLLTNQSTGDDWPGFRHDPAHSGYQDWNPQQHAVTQRDGGLLQNLYVYPNPAKAAPVRIRYYLNQTARVEIKVFNTAGDLVREFSHNGLPAVENEFVWNLENIATGLYFVRAEAKGSSGTGFKLCKFAVIK